MAMTSTTLCNLGSCHLGAIRRAIMSFWSSGVNRDTIELTCVMTDLCDDHARADHSSKVLVLSLVILCKRYLCVRVVVKAIQVDNDKFLPGSVCTCRASSVFIFVAAIVEDEHQIGESVIRE